MKNYTESLFIFIFFIISTLSCGVQTNTKEKSVFIPILKSENKSEPQNGIKKEYFQNGKIRSEGDFVNGKEEGLHKEWEENGNLLSEGFYKNGKANGLIKWYFDGQLVAEGNMIDDKRNGPWKICDVHNINICIDANFINESKEGLWKTFYDSGKLWKEQTWKDDKIISEKCWDEKGNEIICTSI